jgi:HEAT repeat protein
VPSLLELLESDNLEVRPGQAAGEYLRAAAARLLSGLGPEARAAVPALIRLLDEKHPPTPVFYGLASEGIGDTLGCIYDVQWHREHTPLDAAGALCQMGPAAQAAVPSLIRHLKDTRYTIALLNRWGPCNFTIRIGCDPFDGFDHPADPAYVLGALGPAARAAVPALFEVLQDDTNFLRLSAATALWRIEGPVPAVVPVLVDVLRHGSAAGRFLPYQQQREVYEVLGQMGPEARAAVPALTALLRRWLEECEDAEWAATLGWRSGHWAAEALGRMGPAASTALPALRRARNSKDHHVRCVAALAAWRLDKQAGEALPVLVAALTDPGPGNRLSDACVIEVDSLPPSQQVAAQALGQMGPAAAAALPALKKALTAHDIDVRLAAAEAIAQINRQEKAVLPVLLTALRSRDREARETAVRVLGQLGPEAKTAVPALRQALADPEPTVRAAAVEALRRVDPATNKKDPE